MTPTGPARTVALWGVLLTTGCGGARRPAEVQASVVSTREDEADAATPQASELALLLGSSGFTEGDFLPGAAVGDTDDGVGGISPVGPGWGAMIDRSGMNAMGRGTGPGGESAGSGSGNAGFGADRTPSPPTPQLALGRPTVTGALDPERVRGVLVRGVAGLHQCYATEQAQVPLLAGELWVGFTIGAAGQVTEVTRAGSTLPSATVERCVLERFWTMTFPEPEAGVAQVEVGLTFTPAPPAGPGGP